MFEANHREIISMLTYSAPLQIQHLSKRLQLLQEDKFKSYRGLEEQKAEAEWKLYELLSELIMLSDDPGFPSLEKIKEFHSTYPEKNLVSIDDLLSKFWIRIILGKVEIPSAIGSCIRDIDKGEPKYIEIIQLLSNEIENSAKKGLEQIELETLVNQFNNSHPDLFISLKEVEEHITGKTFKTNLHVLKAYSHYRLLLYDNKTQLQFIKLFCEKYNGGGLSSYSIPTIKANFAIEKHRKLYGKCPCLDSLIESGFLETKNDTVVIRHNYGEKNGSFTISSQTAAYVWEKLLAKNLDQNRASLLTIWLDKLVINQNYPIDCIKFLSPFAKHELITAAKEVILNEQDIKNIEDELNKLWFDERFSHHYERLIFPIKETFKITQDSASTYRLILELEERQHQMFHDQHSRWRLSLKLFRLLNF